VPDLKTIQREIRERLSEIEALIEPLRLESEQLKKMLESTSAPAGKEAPRARRDKQSGAGSAPSTARRGRPRSGGSGGGSRVQHTLERIVATPGITAAELAKAMGIKANYLYRVLPALERDGKITKQGKGYHPSASETPAPPRLRRPPGDRQHQRPRSSR
jgi:hypothetical protein